MYKNTVKRLYILSAGLWLVPVYGQHIEEIIVTSTRSDQLLQTLPLSVGVINKDALETHNADHPAEILGLAPGANIQRGSGAEHLTALRSPVLTGGAGAGSFLYLQDGVPLRSAGFGNTNGLLGAQTEQAEQIDVIRGPSGPVYGANAVHGVINVIVPRADKNAASLRLSGDSQSRFKGRASVSKNQGAQAWFAGAAFNKENGYRYDAGLDEQKLLLQHQLSAEHMDIRSIFSGHNLNQETAAYILGEDALNDPQLRRENSAPDAYRDAQSLHLQSRISRPLSDVSKAQVTPFLRWHKMEFLQHWLPSQSVENNGHWSVGLQSDFTLTSDKWNLLTGLDLEYTEGYLKEEQSQPTLFSFTQGVHYDYDLAAHSLAGFIQGEYALGNKLTSSAGVRIDHTYYDYKNRTQDGVVGRFLRPADRNDSFTTLSPKISLHYENSESLMSYMSLARANRPPQTSDLYRLQRDQTVDSAKAEFMDAFELGSRFRLNEMLSAHLAAYAMKKENFFFRDADGFNVNNGKTRHLGIELDVELKITESLSLLSALSYAEHSYQFDREVAREYEVIKKGNEVDTAPRKLANTRLNWVVRDKLQFEAQWVMMGEYYMDAANLHSYPGHHVVNLRMAYAVKKNTDIQLAIRNLSDELYAERADFAFGNERFFPAEPRTVSLSLSMAY
ncbi:Outer membrane receptor proteins, mostly Fe transport [Alteromonadaceae bacterium Bs31]|nr:Outer membrane receptor proteins, mostly Fe transport [Alteromonadaceae bacterium Bs31]